MSRNLEWLISTTWSPSHSFVGLGVPFQRCMQGLGMRFQMSENPLGAPCKLTLMFQFNDGKSASSEYLYGTQSEGPLKEVTDFVRAAVRETEGWYQQQLRMVEKSGP